MSIKIISLSSRAPFNSKNNNVFLLYTSPHIIFNTLASETSHTPVRTPNRMLLIWFRARSSGTEYLFITVWRFTFYSLLATI